MNSVPWIEDASKNRCTNRSHIDCCQDDGVDFNCFGRRKSHRTSVLLMRSHGEMVSAMAHTSEANALLLKRTTEAESRAQQLESKFSDMEDELSRKREKFTSMKTKVEAMTEEKSLLTEEIVMLRSDRDNQLHQNTPLKRSLQELQRSMGAKSTELSDLKERIENCEKQLVQAKENVSKLTAEMDALTTRVASQQNDIETATQKNCELSEKLNQEEAHRSKVDAELANLRIALAGLRQEKNDCERDTQCNANYLQRELYKLSERLKRRHQLVDKLKEDKEHLQAILRDKTTLSEQKHHVCWHKWKEAALNNQKVVKSIKTIPTYPEHSQTKILELELKLERREGLVRTLEDRVRNHEPAFCVEVDPETNLYLDDSHMEEAHYSSYCNSQKMAPPSCLDDSGCVMDNSK